MDIARPQNLQKKRRKRIAIGALTVVLLATVTFLLSRLKPAAPTIERNLVWTGTVKQGSMLRQVRGLGVLVPEEIRWIAARTSGRVERIVIRPGAAVAPDTVVLELWNPDVEQAAANADSQLKASEAELENLKVELESEVLRVESETAGVQASAEQAKLRAEVNEELFKDGLVSPLDLRLSKVTAEQLATSNAIAQKRLNFTRNSIPSRLAVKQAEVDRLRAAARLRREELDALNVRAGMTGVLQSLPLDVGQQVQPGTNLARVADPTRLKAEVRIPETQARDVQIGQVATIDTRNGVVKGTVSRVEPAVQNGTVLVDVALTGELPRGARADLSIDGTIELERLENVVYVDRPAFGQERSTVGIFKLDEEGIYATRTQVGLGRSSVNTIEVVSGLAPGDRVILSDMSQWDTHNRVKLN